MTEENIISKAYEAVEVAVKTGKIKKGTNEVTKSIERGVAKLVLVASDVNPPEVIMHLEPLCREKNILFVKIPSREELGTAAGLNVPTSSVAVVEAGNAEAIIKEMASGGDSKQQVKIVKQDDSKKEKPNKKIEDKK